jgi:hypothetical protein
MATPTSDPPDFVPLALAGMGLGIVLGSTLISAAVWLLRTLQARTTPADTLDLGSAPSLVLFAGMVGGMLAAAVATWRALAPVQSTYRQGGLALVASFATLVVSLIAMPVDRSLGRQGLLALAALGGLVAWRLWLAVRRAAAAV